MARTLINHDMKSDYKIYCLVNNNSATYIGFTNDINRRILEHKSGKVKTTKKFDKFRVLILESAINIKDARKKEKYWKSHTGRKSLKKMFKKI
jgi:putative endonuclease